MMNTRMLAVALLLAAATGLALARPAPFYKWRSKIDGNIACSQTPLGSGWERDSGPYKDSRCEKRILAK